MPEVSSTKYLVTATWDDAPHITPELRERYWNTIPVHEREARARGIPSLGSGAVWPVLEDKIKCPAMEIPEYWPRAYALDVGWKNTAALWGAWDRQSDVVYVWSEYKQGEEKPAVHAQAIQSRGKWIPGVVDPASRGRAQRDGIALIDDYTELGLKLDMADNTVTGPESGIHKVFQRMVSGRLKIFDTCKQFFEEYRFYHRDKNGKIVKEGDHLCDCLRYLVVSGMSLATTQEEAEYFATESGNRETGNATTGY